jgi:NADH-quinone oxidoreductase subunit M
VSHFGFIALGVFALTSQGQSGASFYMVNHGFSTGALFLLVGFLIARRGSDRIADYSGVHNVAPWLAGSFVIAGLSSLALPGLSTFISEFLVLVGTFTRNKVYGVLGTIGIILAAVYILLVIQRTMHGPLSEANRGLADLNQREAWVIAPVLALIVFLGVYPKPVLDVINPAVRDTLKTAHQNDPRPSDVHAIPASATASTGVSK